MDEIKEGYIRISDIVGQWNLLSGIPKHILENKARIGTNVHSKISSDLQDIFFCLEIDEEGYGESWEKWLNQNPLTPFLIEKRFDDDDLKITGRIDLIAETEKGLWIIDFKTSASAHPNIWELQGGFYHHLCKKNGLKMKNIVSFLQLKKDGSEAQLHEFKINKDTWKKCEAALITYHQIYC